MGTTDEDEAATAAGATGWVGRRVVCHTGESMKKTYGEKDVYNRESCNT